MKLADSLVADDQALLGFLGGLVSLVHDLCEDMPLECMHSVGARDDEAGTVVLFASFRTPDGDRFLAMVELFRLVDRSDNSTEWHVIEHRTGPAR